MFKHDILNIYYTLWSLNLIPLLQIPTNYKAQFKNCANFISHFNVGPPMYPSRVYSRLQSHITHHHKTRAQSQKHFCFTSPWVAWNTSWNTSFQQPGGFVSMTTAAEIQIYLLNVELLRYEKLLYCMLFSSITWQQKVIQIYSEILPFIIFFYFLYILY